MSWSDFCMAPKGITSRTGKVLCLARWRVHPRLLVSVRSCSVLLHFLDNLANGHTTVHTYLAGGRKAITSGCARPGQAERTLKASGTKTEPLQLQGV